jgi:glycosyltransferase involved in cell wall biosynthesis
MHSISFIVPVFNAGPFLLEAIASIRNNRCPDTAFEIIVIDDASTDPGTRSILDDLDADGMDLRVLRNRHNLGPARTRNRGVAVSSGEWIAFLDADDIIPAGTMQRRLDILAQVPDTNWFAGEFALLGQQGETASFFPGHRPACGANLPLGLRAAAADKVLHRVVAVLPGRHDHEPKGAFRRQRRLR